MAMLFNYLNHLDDYQDDIGGFCLELSILTGARKTVFCKPLLFLNKDFPKISTIRAHQLVRLCRTFGCSGSWFLKCAMYRF